MRLTLSVSRKNKCYNGERNQEKAPQIMVEQFNLRLSIWHEAIPTYEGGTRLLSHFIQQCDRFPNFIYGRSTCQ